MSTQTTSPVVPFPSERSKDETFIDTITSFVNTAFEQAEGDMIAKGHYRTNAAEIEKIVAAGELSGITDSAGSVMGVVRLFRMQDTEVEAKKSARTSSKDRTITSNAGNDTCVAEMKPPVDLWSFGMLVVCSSQRGTGLGRQLLRYAEDEAKRKGATDMEIILLVPVDGAPHASKEILRAWYARMGYVVFKSLTSDEFLPHLPNVFTRKCEFEFSRKHLL